MICPKVRVTRSEVRVDFGTPGLAPQKDGIRTGHLGSRVKCFVFFLTHYSFQSNVRFTVELGRKYTRTPGPMTCYSE